jgi:pilus assembly protein CpaB
MVHVPDGDNNPVSKIVLERIQVLAVAQDVAINENKPRVVNAVTLEVTPQQAEQIDLARSVGTLSLVLRSQVDTLTVETTGARKLDLIKPTPVAVAASARPASRVSIRKVTAREDDTALRTPGFKQMQIVRGTALSLE